MIEEKPMDRRALELWNSMVRSAKEGDDEAAHSKEDQFHRRILVLIAKGHPQSKEFAAWALKSREVDFCRWCS